ncbi:MAG: Lrp/AsnC family transcriptional regulator [Acidobacteria bacterium]|nr:Lrp/AsnC family transcriptional regulator [Acidobacteriota bacterium]MCB9397023.1 Lrp/AsnC family transcriptional regulator [Acidobacteriota bacterium]
MRIKLDEVDIKILEILQRDGRITNARLAAQVGLSAPPMLERVKKLERMGVIKAFRAILDAQSLGRDFFVYVAVNVTVSQLSKVDEFETRIQALPEVMECYHIAGDIDFLLKVNVADHEAYKRFVVKDLSRIQGINRIHSWVVLNTVKQESNLLLDGIVETKSA